MPACGGREAGDGALHVGRAATMQHAVAKYAAERIVAPLLRVARRHHVGMAREAEMRRVVADAREEIVDRRVPGLLEPQPLAAETERLQMPRERFKRPAVFRRDAAAADQRLGKRDRVQRAGMRNRHFRSAATR